jgi:hypothetical protein
LVAADNVRGGPPRTIGGVALYPHISLRRFLGGRLAIAAQAVYAVGAALSVHAVLAAPLVRCEVTYAGVSQIVEARLTADPYSVQSADIGGRFWFKPVMVGTSERIEHITLYAYLGTPRQPVPIAQATYRPPFPRSVTPWEFTGEQHLYAGPSERELIYRCTLQEVEP